MKKYWLLIVELAEIWNGHIFGMFFGGRQVNTRIHTLSHGPHITHFTTVVVKKWKCFKQVFVLVQTIIVLRQQMTTTKTLHKYSTVISNQIRNYLTANSKDFLETRHGFRYADLLWLVAERAFMSGLKKLIKAWNVISWNIMVQGNQSLGNVSKFIFINRRSWNSKCQGPLLGLVLRTLIWLASTMTQRDLSCVISNRYKNLQKYQRLLHFNLVKIDVVNIQYFLEIYFSQTLVNTYSLLFIC